MSGFAIFSGLILQAQLKATLQNGPVTATTKKNIPFVKYMGNNRKGVKEVVYLQKDDWLVVMAESSNSPVGIDIVDRQSRKTVKTIESTERHTTWVKSWRSVLTFQAPSTDSFDVLCNARIPETSVEDDMIGSDPDTVFANYNIARLKSSWQPADTNWGLRQRLNYLACNWTAGFRTVSKVYDKEKAAKEGKITEYFPESQVAVDDRMQCSIFPLSQGQKMVYFMYSQDTTYAAAKAFYDELSQKLKAATDYFKVSDLTSSRRKNELATTYFGIKIPSSQVPPDYFFVESAGKNQVYLPVSLFLYGDKQKARVLVVMGESTSDVYDIGW